MRGQYHTWIDGGVPFFRSNPGQGVAAFRKWGDDETALNGALRSAMDGVHAALCDNVDTK